MSSTSNFVHLHLHSQYSLLDGAVRLPDLIEQIKALGMPAVAVTDHGNMFGAVDFYSQAIAAGIKPILGCEVYVANKDRRDRTERSNYHLILLARNDEGYKNLKYLVSMGFVEGFYYRPRIDKELLKKHSQGLIGATACLGGEVPTAFRVGGYERALEAAKSLRDLFEPGHFFLEVQSNGYSGQEELGNALRRIGQELNIPLLATNDVHYLKSEDAKAHKVLMCIAKGVTLDDPKMGMQYTDELFLRSAEEMREVMPNYPDAVENTLRVNEMCIEVNPTGPVSLPDYAVPGGESREKYLRHTAHKGLGRRFNEFERTGKIVDKRAYRSRLDHEVDVICEMGFAGYFLIVKDFISHARKELIPVGPGRGSGAGSLVAYSLRITNLDPIPLNLLFERFLNSERVSNPDFDIDFCKKRREEVIAYVVEKYGKNNVGQIATFHQLKSRSAVRDVGRVMGMPYPEVDRIAKLVPEGPNVSLKNAMKTEARLIDASKNNPQVGELLAYAERLENLNRHAGMHAAGIVIGNKPLWEYVPVFKGSDRDQVTQLVSQFDMKFVEKAGLVKFDFLGLKTLTVIDTAVKLINKRPDCGEPLDIDQLNLDDPKVYELISAGNTWGVFQLESKGFIELLRRLKPDCFEDVVAAVALYRPGPLEGGMVDNFVECKHGRQSITYPHSKLESILKETYGVIVYQEQVMLAAQILADYSLGAADIMRRAMGKKKAEDMAKERLKFVAGAEKNGIEASTANDIFELIDKFAGYGFNKSHSAAYALVTFQTAWLKTHYPVEFEAALLTCDQEDSEKVSRYIREGRELGVDILPPNINNSKSAFSVLYPNEDMKKSRILFGLGAIKGVGEAALTAIFASREDGPFTDIFDFANRVDLTKVNKAVVESLVRAGAFDSLTAKDDVNRGQIFGVTDLALERGRLAQQDRENGQINLFGFLDAAQQPNDNSLGAMDANYIDVKQWDERTLLAAEKDAIGFYMSGHPMERHVAEVARLTDGTTETIAIKKKGEKITLAGMVMDYVEKTTKTGKRLAIFALEDLKGRAEVVVYSDLLKDLGDVLTSEDPVFISGMIRVDQRGETESRSIVLKEAIPLQEVRGKKTSEVHMHLDATTFHASAISKLKDILERHPGRCDTFIEINISKSSITTITLPNRFRVNPSDALLIEIDGLAGVKNVDFR
ncbi:MAG: DNA polymerase III subunit alpha [Proteobacteria bacterium]|nr:DNA polymerase III subunit alpha [Pseudomonadota bacterium]